MTAPRQPASWWSVTFASGATTRIRGRDHAAATARATATARSCKPPARVVSVVLDEPAAARAAASKRARDFWAGATGRGG